MFDLGAGVGAVALVMHARGFAKSAVLVDADARACALAEDNVARNGFDRTSVVCGDVLDAARSRRGEAALVVCNPPYFEPGAARPSAAGTAARIGALDRFVRAAREVLGRRGRACFVYPATDLPRLFASLRATGLEPKRLRLVRPTADAPARVALVEARAARPGGLVAMPPLVERDGPGHRDYTRETAKILGLEPLAVSARRGGGPSRSRTPSGR